MKAWIVDDTKVEQPLRWGEAPEPAPKPGQALLRVEAAALNFSDLLMIHGRYQVRPPLPFVPGQEVAGTILVGNQSAFRPGQRVTSKVIWGGFAEQVAVEDHMGFAVPEAMPLAHAAALPVVYPTAYVGLVHHGRLARGETVLVHAAAGALGLAAVEIAKIKGAKVLGTVGSAGKAEVVRSRGADAVFDYSQPDWVARVSEITQGRGADVIFDSVGGAVTEQSLRCIAYGGRLLIAGFSSGTIPALAANRLLLRNASAIGVYWSHEHDSPIVDAAITELLGLYARGRIKPHVDTRWRLDELPVALAALRSRQSMGKIVLRADDGA